MPLVINSLIPVSFYNTGTFIFLGIEYLFVDMISLLVSENRVVLSQNYVLGMRCLGFILYLLYRFLGLISIISTKERDELYEI